MSEDPPHAKAIFDSLKFKMLGILEIEEPFIP